VKGRPVIIVSGCSRGLGQAIAADQLDHGAIVAGFSRGPSPFIEARGAADPERTSFYWQALDATDGPSLKSFVDEVIRRYGRIDGLVNNAGQNLGQFFNLTRLPQIQKLLQVNLEAVMNLTRLVIPQMLLQSGGSIVNLSSISGHRGFAGLSTYGATKAALDGLTRALARELGPRQVRVNAVAPGLLDTDMGQTLPDAERQKMLDHTPLSRLGRCEDVTPLIRFLLSDDARFLTGQSIIIDGGFTC